MNLLGLGGGVLMDEQTSQLAKALEALRALRSQHPDPRQSLKISASVELSIARSDFRELEPERGELGDVVVELVDTAFDGLDLVEDDRIIGGVGDAKLVEIEVLAELGHGGAQGDQVTAHVGDAVTDLGLQRAGAIRVALLERGGRSRRRAHLR